MGVPPLEGVAEDAMRLKRGESVPFLADLWLLVSEEIASQLKSRSGHAILAQPCPGNLSRCVMRTFPMMRSGQFWYRQWLMWELIQRWSMHLKRLVCLSARKTRNAFRESLGEHLTTPLTSTLTR